MKQLLDSVMEKNTSINRAMLKIGDGSYELNINNYLDSYGANCLTAVSLALFASLLSIKVPHVASTVPLVLSPDNER